MLPMAQLKQMAKEQIRGNIGKIFICLLLAGLLVAVSAITIVGPIILMPVIIISVVRIFLKLTEGVTPAPKDIFTGFDVTGKAILLYLLVGLFTMLWMFLLIVPGIIKAISYSMSYFILAENPEMTAREALNESKRITKGHIGEIFVLGLSFILWAMLGNITFGLAYIYVGPYMYATFTNYYKELRASAG